MNRFCTQCGVPQKETARFCTKCGVMLQPLMNIPREAASTVAFDNIPDYQAPVKYQSSSLALRYREGTTENIAGMLCYPLSLLTGMLFLVTTPYNKDLFVRFHAYQSILYFIELFILKIIISILPNFISWLPNRLFWPAAIAGTIWMMYEAYHGKITKLPIIGEIAIDKAGKQ